MIERKTYTPAQVARIAEHYRDYILGIDNCNYIGALDAIKKIPENVRKHSWLGKVSKEIIGDLERTLGRK